MLNCFHRKKKKDNHYAKNTDGKVNVIKFNFDSYRTDGSQDQSQKLLLCVSNFILVHR